MLAVDFAMLPYSWWGDGSSIKRRAMQIGKARSTTHHGWIELLAIRQSDGEFAVIGGGEIKSDELSAIFESRPQDVVWFLAKIDHTKKVGMWAPTSERRSAMLHGVGPKQIESKSDALETLGYASITRDWLKEEEFEDQMINDLLKHGMYLEVHPLYLGYLHNTLSLSAAILLLFSLGWLRAVPAWLATTKAQRRLSRGQCPHYCYSIAGLPEPVCPECGRAWLHTAEDPPTPAD